MTPTWLIGVPPATLQTWLTQAQANLQQLKIGGGVVTVSYSQGDGQKLVTYQRANAAELERHVRDLLQALGLAGPRRPVRFRYP